MVPVIYLAHYKLLCGCTETHFVFYVHVRHTCRKSWLETQLIPLESTGFVT